MKIGKNQKRLAAFFLIIVVVVLAISSVIRRSDQISRDSFPLNDPEATYRIVSAGIYPKQRAYGEYHLAYQKGTETKWVYIDKSPVDLKEYEDKGVILNGRFRVKKVEPLQFSMSSGLEAIKSIIRNLLNPRRVAITVIDLSEIRER